MNDKHYGYVINTHYDWINMITRMQTNQPQRYEEFQYSQSTIYHYLDRLQHEQNVND